MLPSLQSALGLLVFLALAFAFSENRRRFPSRIVLWGFLLQFGFAWLILKTTTGLQVFNGFQNVVTRFIGFANEGSSMVFGGIANPTVLGQALGPQNGFILAITVTSTIILVSAVSSALYHYGILQRIVHAIAWVMRRTMATSGSETLAAAANIFIGQTEAPLVIKPYLPHMTRSELFALMVGGMATIAGGVLSAYVGFGIPAGHLLTASVLSAPASLMISKILIPETEVSQTAQQVPARTERETINGIEALCRGASDGMMLSLNVMAMIIAFVAIVALLNHLLATSLATLGYQNPTPLQTLLGWLNAPCAWLIGIPWKDCQRAGAILGERIVLNEFVGYLSTMKHQAELDPRSFKLLIYALCGFANVASISIQIGGIGALAPSRRPDLARLGLKALFGGLLACYLTACVVGIIDPT